MFSPRASFKGVHYITSPLSLVASSQSQRGASEDERTHGQVLEQEALVIWIRKTAAGVNKKNELANE